MGLSSRFLSFLRREHREQQPEVDARDAAGDREKRRHRVAEQRRARDRAAVAFRMAVRAPKRERKQREERKQRQRALIDEDAEVFVVRARDGEVGGLAAALPVERRDVAQVQRPASAVTCL